MPTGSYVAHRNSQRELILETAQDLFINKGAEQVTLGEIADECRLTRATLYKYFANKEEIAAEIFLAVTKGWADRDAVEVWGVPGTGYQTVERFLLGHFRYLLANMREARFLAEFDYLYAKHLSVETAKGIFSTSLEGERTRLADALARGQADGSIRNDLAPAMVLAAVLTFMSGLSDRLGGLGSKSEEEMGVNTPELFETSCRVFLDGLKPRSHGFSEEEKK